MQMPFIDLGTQAARLRSEIDHRIGRVLDHGQFIMGPEVDELESELARRADVRHVVTVSSGTDALLAALMAMGVGPGDRVLLPAFTFPATAEVVIGVGARPVFADVDPATANVGAKQLDHALSADDRPSRNTVLMVVDLYGLPADYPAVQEVAEASKALIVADAAQSFGGSVAGRPVGSLAHTTATSFFPAKPLGAYGDGGAILTDDDKLADACRSIRSHGQGVSKYDIVRPGLNARLDTLQAAVLLAKLGVFDEELDRRQAAAALYTELLGGSVGLLDMPPGRRSAWAQYTVLVPDRERVRAALASAGVPTQVYYPRPLHLQPAYEMYGAGAGTLPVSERLAEQVLSLPFHPYMEDADIKRVVTALSGVLRSLGL